MKKIYVSITAMAVLCGCSDKDENIISDDSLKPIELNAAVSLSTESNLTAANNLTDVGIAGWEAEKSEDAVDYTQDPAWHAHIQFVPSTDPYNVTFMYDQQPYYNPDSKIYTHMKAWYPCGEYTSTPNKISDHKVTFTNNGTRDVMMAPIVIGSKTEKCTDPLAFKHVTSQVIFNVKSGEGLAVGTTIRNITIKGAQYPKGFDLSKSFTDGDAITYSTAEDLKVPNIHENQEISSTPVQAGDPLMIRPFPSKTFTVDIVTNKATYENQTVTLDTGTSNRMEAGYIYNITLTFGQAGLELKATVEAWKQATGGAEIQ